MDTKLILAFAAVGLFCFVVGLLVGRAGRRDGQVMVRPNIPSADSFGATPPVSLGAATRAGPPGAGDATGEAVDERLRQLLRENKLIEAIKLYRERTNCGLKEAKEAVEAEKFRMLAAGPAQAGPTFGGGGTVTHERVSVKLGGEVLEMLSSGRREEVVRRVRERAGISEAEAEAVVAKLETLMGRLKQ